MRRLYSLFGAILLVLALVRLAWTWTGSDPGIGINYPNAITDNETISSPFSPLGWCFNSTNAVDFYELWLIEDTDNDAVIDAFELNLRTVYKLEDYNLINRFSQRLTPRYHFTGKQATKYFLFIWAKDVVGNSSASTNIAGLGPEGDGTRTDSMIAYFTVSGLTP